MTPVYLFYFSDAAIAFLIDVVNESMSKIDIIDVIDVLAALEGLDLVDGWSDLACSSSLCRIV